MKIEPKVRGFICTSAHPVGCKQRVVQQIDYVKSQPKLSSNIKNVLVIGASTGYGLATRIVSSFGLGAKTIGVFFEREATEKRTASPGWYNSAAFEQAAKEAGIYARSFCGDAFSSGVKKQVIEAIKQDFAGKVDLIVYSLAAPRRTDHEGNTYQSALKPIGKTYDDKTVDTMTGVVSNVEITPATTDEIVGTEKVMGGEDWALWIEDLIQADVLAEGALSLAYSYIGPKMTYPIYREGTIGVAKEHLEKTAIELNAKMQKAVRGRALVSVNKALVTQASSAIPVVPLYISILYKVMEEEGMQEGCIEQMQRLFAENICSADTKLDDKQRIRMDDWELKAEVQKEVADAWGKVVTENLEQLSDIEGCRKEFYQLFGFQVDGVDYNADVDINVPIPSIVGEEVC